jgi:hypothetical protein
MVSPAKATPPDNVRHIADQLADKVTDAAKTVADQATARDEAAVASRDVLLGEIRNLSETVTIRFDAVNQQHSDMKSWMERLADHIDRQATVLSKFLGVETRIGQYESTQSDMKLDIASLQQAQETNKIENVKTHLVRTGIFASIAAVASSIITILVAKVFS